jgi:hypothetical protein
MYKYLRSASENSRLEQRATKEWSRLAGEPVRVESHGGTLYALGSELACLRLWYKMGGKGKASYSSNLKTWFWCED